MLSVPKRIKDMLDVLRKEGTLSYAKTIEYLLVKSGHLPPENAIFNYAIVDDFINGAQNEQEDNQETEST